MEPMTFKQIGEQLGISTSAAEQAYQRAIIKFEMGLVSKRVYLEDLLSEDYHQRRVWNVEEAE
jgi:hypothetical protein